MHLPYRGVILILFHYMNISILVDSYFDHLSYETSCYHFSCDRFPHLNVDPPESQTTPWVTPWPFTFHPPQQPPASQPSPHAQPPHHGNPMMQQNQVGGPLSQPLFISHIPVEQQLAVPYHLLAPLGKLESVYSLEQGHPRLVLTRLKVTAMTRLKVNRSYWNSSYRKTRKCVFIGTGPS